jgi:DNA helicase IV
MTLQELEETVRDIKYIGDAIERLLVQFVSNARSLRLRPSEIPQRLNQSSPRVYHFGLLGTSILARYEEKLLAEERIDFADMLHRAADILEGGTNPLPRFEHILVDEFQDTSAAMARFLRALLLINHARLFAVGDDWQAIYGFAGGDVDHIVRFEDRFGYASKTMLNVNYRSPSVIVAAGSALIAHNTNQIPKQIQVSSRDHGEAFVHEVPDDDTSIIGETIRLVQEERVQTKNDTDILVLSRTKHILEKVQDACKSKSIPVGYPDRDIPGVRILSGHKAKGLEAPVVIIVNASDHIFGFPSKVENLDVLAPVRMSSGNDEAEERRLFYVAVTRAMKRLHLIVRQGLPSPYIAEIEGSIPANTFAVNQAVSARPGFRFSDTFHVKQIYSLSDRQKRAGIRQSGLLATNTDRYKFTSFLPFDLKESGTYRLEGVFRDQPYGDLQQVRLDVSTRVESRRSLVATRTITQRALVPRPSSSYQPTAPSPTQQIIHQP